ncbi:MAG: type II toxin-antitoxin system RelE/ParE family toxin [Caldilineaceae bacterium]
MRYRVKLSKAIQRQMQALPGHIRPLARQQILGLAEDPRPQGAKELDGHPDYYRIWVGGRFRVVWQIVEDEQLVDILYVGPKLPNLYEQLGLA